MLERRDDLQNFADDFPRWVECQKAGATRGPFIGGSSDGLAFDIDVIMKLSTPS